MIPLTPANVAFIAATGTLQLGSAALQATELAVAIIVVIGFAGVLLWQFGRWGQRRVARFMAAHPDAGPAAEEDDDLDVPDFLKESRD